MDTDRINSCFVKTSYWEFELSAYVISSLDEADRTF